MQLILKLDGQEDDNSFNPNITQDILQPETPTNDKRLLQLEGQCKIHSLRLLEVDYLKTILLIIPIIITVIPLLLLKYYKSIRVKAFFKDSQASSATYIFIEATDGNQDIQDLLREEGKTVFYFKKLKYLFKNGTGIPIGYQYEQVFSTIKSKDYAEQGVNDYIVAKNQVIFGKNEHRVDIPNYFEYIFDIMLKPFFLLQYAICVIFILENIVLYAIVYIVFSLLTTTINYILLYISFIKIRQIAQKQIQVQAFRNGERIIIKSHDLVPGDIVVPRADEEVCYDGILVDGEVYVNESSLTGQSIPVGKFPAEDLSQAKQQNRWLYEGAKILQSRPESRVVVVNVGYATRRGRIIRKILTRVPKVPDFFMSAVFFLIETCIIGLILYWVTLPLMVGKVIPAFIVYRLLDVIAWSFPPTFPIFFNISYSFSLIRLKWKGIMGTEPQKATQAANIKTFCFDKTGTLTQNQIQVYDIIKFINEDQYQNITQTMNNSQNKLIIKLFSSCHTVRQLQDSFLGDEVDLRMFLFSKFAMTVPEDKKIRFKVQDKEGDQIQILRINQFESKFQNMSVLVHDVKQKKYFAFIKGAPERIDKNSTLKVKQFQNLVSSLSLRGYRTIAYGYKQVSHEELNRYLQGDRQIFQSHIKALGLVAFENKLKTDTRQTIDRLIESDIEPKMITGDNIYIAVQTGYRSGILREDQKVILLQGRKQNNIEGNRFFQGIILEKNGQKIIQKHIELNQNQEYLNQVECAIAIDNDFLMMRPQPIFTPKIKLFARISPENKAAIVRKFKDQQCVNYNQRSRAHKWFGPGMWKVGMCGDGANDLMAIRQADVGVAISDSDASYGASFTITQLLQVEHIVRESKCASQTIVDTIRYFGTISFLKIITSILLVSDVTYFSANQITYFNFAHSVWLAVFIGLSSPSQKTSKHRPHNNLMSLQNHIIYWANIFFPTIAFVAGYFYLIKTDKFAGNLNQNVTMASGYIGIKCHTSTIVWLMINLPFIANAFFIYNSKPFKCSFHKNIPLLITTIVNLAAAIAFFFIIPKFPANFYLQNINMKQSGIVLLIVGSILIFSGFFNYFYKRLCLN